MQCAIQRRTALVSQRWQRGVDSSVGLSRSMQPYTSVYSKADASREINQTQQAVEIKNSHIPLSYTTYHTTAEINQKVVYTTQIPVNQKHCPAASSAGRKVHGAQLQTWPRVRVRRSPRPASGATTLSSRVVSECSVAAAATFIACVGPARADGLASDAIQPMGSRSSISSPADGHKAVGLSFTGLVGLVSALAGCVPSRLQGSTGSFDGHCGVECADSWRVRTAS